MSEVLGFKKILGSELDVDRNSKSNKVILLCANANTTYISSPGPRKAI